MMLIPSSLSLPVSLSVSVSISILVSIFFSGLAPSPLSVSRLSLPLLLFRSVIRLTLQHMTSKPSSRKKQFSLSFFFFPDTQIDRWPFFLPRATNGDTKDESLSKTYLEKSSEVKKKSKKNFFSCCFEGITNWNGGLNVTHPLFRQIISTTRLLVDH